jgi:hypothetical protein
VLKIKEKVKHQVHLLVHVLNEFGLVFKHIFFIIALVYYHGIFILFLRCLLFLVILSNKVSEDLRDHLDTKESFLVLLKRCDESFDNGNFMNVIPCLDDISDGHTCLVDQDFVNLPIVLINGYMGLLNLRESQSPHVFDDLVTVFRVARSRTLADLIHQVHLLIEYLC